jgi:hypothetical protein
LADIYNSKPLFYAGLFYGLNGVIQVGNSTPGSEKMMLKKERKILKNIFLL